MVAVSLGIRDCDATRPKDVALTAVVVTLSTWTTET